MIPRSRDCDGHVRGTGPARWHAALLAAIAGTAGLCAPVVGQEAKPAEGAGSADKKADAPAMEAAKPVPQATEAPPAGATDPLGYAGEGSYGPRVLRNEPTSAVPDRWRIGWPSWDRYNRQTSSDSVLQNAFGGDIPYTRGDILNPYDRNVLKGDYPIIGNEYFLVLGAVSDSLFLYRTAPTPSGNAAQDPNRFGIFGDGRATVFNQNFILTAEFFKGYTAYRPVDYLIRVSPIFNLNSVKTQENVTNVSPAGGDERFDTFSTLQEAFIDIHLADTSEWFDVLVAKVGRQLFVSDFRGFIFNDLSDGVRLTLNANANKQQYNLAFFNSPEKDTNSLLNELNWREQQVMIANAYFQDFLGIYGYTVQGSFHWNHDQSNERLNGNGVPVRPDLAGGANVRNLDVFYLGLASDGHIGRLNVSSAFYYAFGNDERNPIAGRRTDISAFMGALELSIDYDWLRPKVSFLYASGDNKPDDDTATGFDSIFDDPVFAGGPSSYFQNQSFGLFGVAVDQPRSFYNTLKASKFEGQSNFVNPGTVLFNAGLDAEILPTLRTSLNANALFFADTSTLELFLDQNSVDQELGYEVNLFTQYRPFLNNNIIFTAGQSVFFPGEGFGDIFEDNKALYQFTFTATLTY